VIDLEVPPCVVDYLPVARMVRGFYRHYLLQERRDMVADVLDQLRLLIGRAGNENKPRASNRIGHLLQKIVVLGRLAAANALRFVVKVARRVIRVDDQSVYLGGVEVEDARLVMVDPDYRMEVCRHWNPRWCSF
jgi:hypothetical protein